MEIGREQLSTLGAHLALVGALVAGGTVAVILLLLLAMVLAPVAAALLTYAVCRTAVAARPQLYLVRDPEAVPARIRARLPPPFRVPSL
jgi:hypothetical protein